MTVLMPVYNTVPHILEKSLNSVLLQAYKKWELCIVDDASTHAEIRPILERYAKKTSRIRVLFAEENEGIAATINKAAQMASGEFVGVLDHDDELHPFLLLEYVLLLNKHPDADCIYCDEDKIDEQGNHCDFWFKSEWNPDLSLSFNYVMHFVMCREALFRSLGGARKAYEGSQDYDLLLRIAENTDKIYHIPKILYHWRMGEGSIASGPEAKPNVFVTGLAALNDTLRRRDISGIAEDAPDAWKGVYRVRRDMSRVLFCSIIVVSHGDRAALSRILFNIFDKIPQIRFEVLVCCPSAPDMTQNNFSKTYKGGMTIRWIRFHEPFSLPRMVNTAVQEASGNVLFFLDDTMELISGESYTGLLEQIQREEVGAVGGKIYYENGLVEHGGIILGPFDLLGYAHRATWDRPGYAGLNRMICNYSAVMGLGMMTRKKLFTAVGGLDQTFERAYWDADYCLRLRERDYLITYTPYAKLHHHIRVKTIPEMITEPEATHFRNRWQQIIDRDPYFNINFSREVEDFTIG